MNQGRLGFVVGSLSLALAVPAATATIWYVDDSAPAGGNGTSWATAFQNLAPAISAASSGDEIRIGLGTYKPAGPGGSRSTVYTVNKSLTIRGGYFGYAQLACCPDLFSTDPALTTLSGDLNGDDDANFGNTSDNSFRVVHISSPATTVTIERLTIRAGNGSSTGSGLYVPPGVTVRVDRCNFRDCDSTGYGGAVDHNGSINSIYALCKFYHNRAAAYGGGMSLSSGNGARVINCGFYGNKLTGTLNNTGGGGIWINGQSTLYNCVFSGNVATPASSTTPQGGGGAIATGAGPITISNCTLYLNSASNGFGLYVTGAAPTVTNTIFHDYYQDYEVSGTATITYCAGYFGAFTGTGNISVGYDYTLWSDANGADDIIGTMDDDFTLRRGYPGAAVIDQGTAGGVISDVADLDGDSDTVEGTPVDFSGFHNRRYTDPVMPDAVGSGNPPIDMGAYEAVVPGGLTPVGSVVYVAPDGYGHTYYGSGSSWNNALGDFGAAAYVAATFPSVVQEIRFAGGLYRGTGTFYPSFSLYSRSNLLIRGGYAGPYYANPDARDVNAFPTVFDGDRDANDPPVFTDPLHAAYSLNLPTTINVGYGCNNITIDGIRFRNSRYGGCGGVFNDGVNTVVRNCVVERGFDIAGAFVNGWNEPTASLTLVNCDVVNCIGERAGAIWSRGAALSLLNTRLLGNARLDSDYDPYDLESAGGVQLLESVAFTAVNCLFAGNIGDKGGAIGGQGSTASLTNCTLASNTARTAGGGLWKAGTAPTLSNCIITGNSAPANPQLSAAGAVVQNSLVQGGFAGATNRDGDPRFADAHGADGLIGSLDDDYRLLPASAAIDIGSAAMLPTDTADLDADSNTIESLPLDLGLTARNADGDLNGTAAPDAGCYEFAVSTVLNTSTGLTYPTIAGALAAALPGQGIAAPSSAFNAEPTLNFAGKAVSITSTGGVTQNAGGIYTLADGAAISTATAGAQTMTLSGELRVPAGTSATATANTISLASTGRVSVLADATLNLNAGSLSGSGAYSLFPNSSVLLTGSASTTGTLNAQNASTLNVGGALTLGGGSTLLGSSVIAGATTISATTNWTGSSFNVASLSVSAPGRFTGSGNIYAPISNSGRVYTIGNSVFVGNLTNNAGGIITVQIGTATLIGTLVNNGTINGVLFNPPLPPPGPGATDDETAFYHALMADLQRENTDRTGAGDGMFIRGDYIAGAASSLSLPDPVWRLTVAGAYDVAINSNANYDMRLAELVMAKPDAGGSTLEAMSLDRGAVNAGLDRTLPASYPIGTLRIGAGASVSTTDARDNANDGQATCEAVYCENLIVESGAVLTATSCRVYYKTLTNHGTISTPANVIRVPPPCGGADFNHDGVVNTADLTLLLLRFGQSAPVGSPAAAVDLNADGVITTADLTLLLLQFGRTCA